MIKISKLFFLAALICSFALPSAWAATYTTNATTITQASGFTPAGTLAGGDTLIIETGRTNHLEFVDVDGASGNPITITNPSDEKISITETVSASPYGSITFRSGCRYIVLDGSNNATETYGIYLANGTFGIRLHESEDIEIKYIEITSRGIQWQDGTWTASQDVENIKIHHCYIHDVAGEGIYLGNSAFVAANDPSFKDCKIYSNTIEDCAWDCIQLGAADQGTNEIYENHCENCGTAGVQGQTFGIVLGIDTTGDIYQNKVINSHNAGIRAGSSTGQLDIHDNAIVDSGTYGIGQDSSTAGQTIINNTVVNRDTGVTDTQGIATKAGADLGEVRYNIVVGSSKAGEISTSYTILNDNRESTSISGEYFVDATGGDFHLTASSPALNAGVGAGYSTTDYDGNARPNGPAADIGAYEYDTQITNASPAQNDTGVSITVDLNWTNPAAAVNIDLLFDKKSEHDPPTTVKLNDQDVETWDCGTLDYSTEYVWRVDINHTGGTETGTVYYFTTTAESNPPTPAVGMNYFLKGTKGTYLSKGVKIQ